MAVLVNGDGNKAIWAQQDADLIASLAGNVTAIADVGSKFAATQEDANTIGLADGVIVTKEGRRIQLNAGNTDLFDIPTGTAGVTSYYIIGYHLYTQSDTSQVCETFVKKMNSSSATITEDTFRGGATEVYVSCYRVIQTGLNITAINALLPNIESLNKLELALTDKSDKNPAADIEITGTSGEIVKNFLTRLYNLIDSNKLSVNSKIYLYGVYYRYTSPRTNGYVFVGENHDGTDLSFHTLIIDSNSNNSKRYQNWMGSSSVGSQNMSDFQIGVTTLKLWY